MAASHWPTRLISSKFHVAPITSADSAVCFPNYRISDWIKEAKPLRTKASLIYRRTKNLRAVQLLLGHTKLESTVRYLGIAVADALEMAEQTEI